MSSTPASTLPEEKRQKILTEVAARYRLLCQQGLGAVARATAINRHVPKVLRGQNNGDRNRWWEWLDQAIKTPARTPPPP